MKGVGKMKKSQEIIGLPVFSIIKGSKVGQVKDLVINPEGGKLDFILISDESWYSGARVLPFKDLVGIGEYAVTVESENLLLPLETAAEAKNLLNRNVNLKGSRVMTNKGNLIGVVSEYGIDENNGQLYHVEYKASQEDDEVAIILAADVLTYGAEIIVVKEKSDQVGAEKEASSPMGLPSSQDTSPTKTESDGATLYKEKQRTHLLGKRLTQDISGPEGILFKVGQEITEEILDLAEEHDKLAQIFHYAE